MKMKIYCSLDDGEDKYDYRSCAGQNTVYVIYFQVAMALIGGLAYWGVQRRKKNSMTAFENRKYFGNNRN
jgi:hypothetical protein